MRDGSALLGCGHKTYFTNPALPGRPFWRHFVCFWPLKHNKRLVLAERAMDVTVSAQEKLLWRARVLNGLKRRENNTLMQQWRIRKLKILSTAPKRELKSYIAAFSFRCADVKRRSKREDSVLNHSRCFIITDLIWWFVWIYLLI